MPGVSARRVFSSGLVQEEHRARDQSVLRMRVRELVMARPRFGYNRIHTLLRREGWRVNKKRVRRRQTLEALESAISARRVFAEGR